MEDKLTKFFSKENIEKMFLNSVKNRIMYCYRCKRTWLQRSSKKPKRCKYCNSPYYESPKKVELPKRIRDEFLS